MLTAKGIGGGSAKVTNGILQEMYAAEGEIPAGTFVDVRESLGDPESSESFVVLGSSSLDSSSYRIHHVKINGFDFLIYIFNGSAAVPNINVNIKYQKLEANTYINMPDLSVSGSPGTIYGNRFNTADGGLYFNPIILNSNKILFIDYCYCERTSSVYSGYFMYFVVECSDSGELSAVTNLKFLKFYDGASSKLVSISNLKAHKLTDTSIGCFTPYYNYAYASSGSLSQVTYKVSAFKLSISDSYVLSVVKELTIAQGSISSNLDNYDFRFSVSDLMEIQSSIVFYYQTYKMKSDTYVNKYFVGVDKDTWNKLSVKQNTNDLTLTNYITRVRSIGDCLILFIQPSNNKQLSIETFSIQKNSTDLIATPLNSLDSLENNDLIPDGYTGYPDEISDNGVIMITKKSTSSPYKQTIKLLQFVNQAISELTDWFYAPAEITDLSSNFVIFQGIDNVVVLLSYYTAYVCKLGTFYPFAYLPMDSFNGLAKTMCTKTKKGQVWMLKVLKFTLLKQATISGIVNNGIHIDTSGNIYCCNGTEAFKFTDSLTESWKKTFSGLTYSACALIDNYFLLCSKDGYVTCLDANDGSQIWKKLLTNGSTSNYAYSACTYKDGVNCYLCVGVNNGVQTYVVDDQNLTLAASYSYEHPGTYILQVAYKAGFLYTTSMPVTENNVKKGYVRKHTVDLSSLTWEAICADACYGIDIAKDGSVYLGCDDKSFQKLDAFGQRIFNVTQPDYVNGVKIGLDNNIYASLSSAAGNTLICFDSNGKVLAAFQGSDKLYNAMAVFKETNIFVKGASGLYKFELEEAVSI